MNSKNQQKKKEIDWMITLVPLALIVALCIVFFFAPEQSNQVLDAGGRCRRPVDERQMGDP